MGKKGIKTLKIITKWCEIVEQANIESLNIEIKYQPPIYPSASNSWGNKKKHNYFRNHKINLEDNNNKKDEEAKVIICIKD